MLNVVRYFSVSWAGLETAKYADQTWIWIDGRTLIWHAMTRGVKRLVQYNFPIHEKLIDHVLFVSGHRTIV